MAQWLHASVGHRHGAVATAPHSRPPPRGGGQEVTKEVEDDHGEASQLNYLCFVTWIRGRVAEAEPLGREALSRMRALGDTEGVIWALINLGAIARYSDDLDGADLLLGQCLDLCEDMSFREGVGWVLNQQGAVARLRGDSERALGLQRASLAEHQTAGRPMAGSQRIRRTGRDCDPAGRSG